MTPPLIVFRTNNGTDKEKERRFNICDDLKCNHLKTIECSLHLSNKILLVSTINNSDKQLFFFTTQSQSQIIE